MGHGGGQVGGAAAPAQRGEGALVGVQRGGQRGGEVQVGEVGEGTARVEGGGDEGDVGGLVRRRENVDAGDLAGPRSGRGGIELLGIPGLQ